MLPEIQNLVFPPIDLYQFRIQDDDDALDAAEGSNQPTITDDNLRDCLSNIQLRIICIGPNVMLGITGVAITRLYTISALSGSYPHHSKITQTINHIFFSFVLFLSLLIALRELQAQAFDEIDLAAQANDYSPLKESIAWKWLMTQSEHDQFISALYLRE